MDNIAYERQRFRKGYAVAGTRRNETLIDEGWHRSRTGAEDGHERIIPFQNHDWMAEGACLVHDPDLFHPGRGGSPKRAIAICETCPVMVECNAYAEATGSLGVWGGKMRKRHGRAQS